MKRKIILHGYLHDLYPHEIEVEAANVAEALRSLVTIPELLPEQGPAHSVKVDGVENELALFSKNLNLEEIHVRPLVSGSGGNGGLTQVLLGITLVAVAFVVGPAGFTLMGMNIAQSTIFLMGAGMIAGGVLQMLAPVPEFENDEDRSKYLSGQGNTVKLGTRIPLLFGARKVGGHYVSFDKSTKSVVSQIASGEISTQRLYTDEPLTEEEAQNRFTRFGTGPMNYVISRDIPSVGFGMWEVEPAYTKTLAQGQTDTLNPVALARACNAERDFYTTFTIPFRPQVGGEFVFSAPDWVGTDLEAPNRTLVAGEEVVLTVTFTVGSDADDTISFDAPEPTLLVSIDGAEPVSLTEVPQAPPETELEELEDIFEYEFLEHDKPQLANGITPIRPIFASSEASPTNIPTSEWRA